MGMTAREFIISVSDKLACSDNGNPCLDTSGGLGLTAREFITDVLDKLACSDAPDIQPTRDTREVVFVGDIYPKHGITLNLLFALLIFRVTSFRNKPKVNTSIGEGSNLPVPLLGYWVVGHRPGSQSFACVETSPSR